MRWFSLAVALLAIMCPRPAASEQPPPFVLEWGTCGAAPGQMQYPVSLAVSTDGQVYVPDHHNHRIQVFTESGELQFEWGEIGSGPGQFYYPYGIDFDASGTVYIAEQYNYRIQKFTPQGAFLDSWGEQGSLPGQLGFVQGLTIDDDNNVYLADTGNDLVQKFSSDGAFIDAWPAPLNGGSTFYGPYDLDFGSDGLIYVANTGGHNVQVITKSGEFVREWGGLGSGTGELHTPIGISASDTGPVYVLDQENHRVQKFSRFGQYLSHWGTFGSQPTEFNYAHGVVAHGSAPTVFVVDTYNCRIQKFEYPASRVWHIAPDGSGDAPTIQAGIDSATVWDTVQLAPGVFYERGIAISQDTRLLGAPGPTPVSIIDAEYIAPILTIDATAPGTAISNIGFRNSNGHAVAVSAYAVIDSCDFSFCQTAGGNAALYMYDALVRECSFYSNSALGGGATVLMERGRMENCYFEGNSAPDGGALRAIHGTISGCTFDSNSASRGGAVFVQEASPEYPVRIEDCVFQENHATSQGGAVFCSITPWVHVERCTFADNTCSSQGGALSLDGAIGTWTLVQGCVFESNSATLGGAIHGVNWVPGAPVPISECVFAHNTADEGGAVFSLGGVGLDSVTLTGNSATAGAAFAFPQGSWPLKLYRAVVAINLQSEWVAGGLSSTDQTVACSDIWGNEGGDWLSVIASAPGEDGNFAADPLFCAPQDGGYGLHSDSPCAPDSTGGCGLIGALPVSCGPSGPFSIVADSSTSDPGSATGFAWMDMDGDGDSDGYVGRASGSSNRLLRNDAVAGFLDVSGPPIDDPGNAQGLAVGDYDNDGDPDLYVSNLFNANRLFRNDGSGAFADQITAPLNDGGHGTDASWIDVDNDGDLDLYLSKYDAANRLFRNDGAGFVESTPPALADAGADAASAWCDYDGDGDLDVYLSLETGTNKLVRNDGGGVFSDATLFPLGDTGTSQGAAWGDFDGDGDLDLYLCNFGQPNRLFRNEGGGNFTNRASGALADSSNGQSGTWADYDNDRDLDLVLTNFGQTNIILRNDGNETFESIALPAQDGTEQSLGAAWADYDQDGDLDLFITNLGQEDRLYRNELDSPNSWLQVDLEGTTSNRSAIGTRIAAIDLGGAGTITRELGSNHGFWSANAHTVHFGLGAETQVDLLWIRWPSGLVETYENVPANQRIKIVEGSGIVAAPEVNPLARLTLSAYPNPFRSGTTFQLSRPFSEALSVTVYDVTGRRVWTAARESGAIQMLGWDGRSVGGRVTPTGIYFYRVEAGRRTFNGKLVKLQ